MRARPLSLHLPPVRRLAIVAAVVIAAINVVGPRGGPAATSVALATDAEIERGSEPA